MTTPFEKAFPKPRILMVDASSPDFAQAMRIRRAVFVEEQNVPADEEYDSDDARAAHYLAFCDGAAVATLRVYDDAGWLHVGRVAVLPEWRRFGLGRKLMERCIEEGGKAGFTRSFLNSQCDKTEFYRKLGYVEIGPEFMEAGIPHVRMEAQW